MIHLITLLVAVYGCSDRGLLFSLMSCCVWLKIDWSIYLSIYLPIYLSVIYLCVSSANRSNAYCIAPSQHHSLTASLPHCITISLHHTLTASLPDCITSSLHHSLTASLPHCITPSQHHFLTASHPHCITLLYLSSLLHCITPYFITPSLHHCEYNMYAVRYCQPSTTRWAVPLLFLALNESTSVLHLLH